MLDARVAGMERIGDLRNQVNKFREDAGEARALTKEEIVYV